MKGTSGVIYEQIEHMAGRSARVTATFEAGQLWLSVEGYGDIHGDPKIICLEIGNDRLTLHAWADRESEEPTTLSIEGARA